MGSEFLKRTKKTIVKHLDTHRMLLATPDLLTAVPADQPRCYLASMEGGATIVDGVKMMAEPEGGAIRLRQGNAYVGRLDNPGPDIVAQVTATGGAGATVQRVHKLSNKMEVTLW